MLKAIVVATGALPCSPSAALTIAADGHALAVGDVAAAAVVAGAAVAVGAAVVVDGEELFELPPQPAATTTTAEIAATATRRDTWTIVGRSDQKAQAAR